ncbi:MAG: hypothetical protein QOJ98_3126 [Acidobacteriota bacterium]|nr:hypothetical protein [Acidobacteriota bacterium]
MRMIRNAVLLAGALMVPASTAFAWNLTPCSQQHLAKRGQVAQELRAAQPGSLKYIPKPFPKNGVEVVEDYKYQILSRWAHTAQADLSADQRALMEGLQQNTLAIEVQRVQNWSLRRCNDAGTGDTYHLLSISDRASGKELTRAALHESGVLEQTGFAGAADRPLASLPAVAAQIEKTIGAPATQPVYVTSTGTLRCDVLMPCVAVHSRASVLLVAPDGEMFEIPAQRRLLSFKTDLGNEQKRNAKQKELAPRGEVVTSLGGDQFVVVRSRGRLVKE